MVASQSYKVVSVYLGFVVLLVKEYCVKIFE